MISCDSVDPTSHFVQGSLSLHMLSLPPSTFNSFQLNNQLRSHPMYGPFHLHGIIKIKAFTVIPVDLDTNLGNSISMFFYFLFYGEKQMIEMR